MVIEASPKDLFAYDDKGVGTESAGANNNMSSILQSVAEPGERNDDNVRISHFISQQGQDRALVRNNAQILFHQTG